MRDGEAPTVDRGARRCQTPRGTVPPDGLRHYIAAGSVPGLPVSASQEPAGPWPDAASPAPSIPLTPPALRLPPRRRSLPVESLLCAALLPLLAGVVHAQEPPPDAGICAAGRVADVHIENGSIFDLEGREESRFFWAFRLANRLHVDTSPRFIRRELLLRPGDCFDADRASESARLLREYRFLADAEVEAVQRPDGDWDIRVTTRDEWTTKPKATVRMDEGIRLERAAFVEENLAGRGITAGIFLEERREQKDYGLQLETPQTFGTRLDTSLRVGRTRVGSFVDQSVLYPFVGEVGRFGLRQRYRSRESYFPYYMGNDPRGREVLVPVLEENQELTVALRLGVPGNLTILGAGLSRERLAFPGYPGSVEVTLDGDYDAPQPAPEELVEAIRRQEHPRSTARANFLLGQRSIRFVPRRGLDALDGVQDVAVGTDLGIMLARSLGFLQVGQVDRVDDLFTRVSLFKGAATRSWVANANVQVEGRQVYSGSDAGGGWRDVLAEGDLLLYGQPDWLPSQTLLVRISAAGGWTVDTPYQLSLGGRHGLRGYPEGTFPGGRRLVITLEDRIRFPSPWPELLDTGATVFVDAGAVTPGDVPFGQRSGLKASAGAGLRLGLPAGTRGVVRLDVTFPLEGGSKPMLRISLGEIVGLVAGFVDEDLQRSRRAGVAQQFAGVGR